MIYVKKGSNYAAKMISFQFIKSGLVHKKDCSYLSEEDVEAVKREMGDAGIGVNKYTQDHQLHIYQVPSLTDYHHNPDDSQIKGKRIGPQQPMNMILNDSPTMREVDRIVLRCVYKITSEQQISQTWNGNMIIVLRILNIFEKQ